MPEQYISNVHKIALVAGTALAGTIMAGVGHAIYEDNKDLKQYEELMGTLPAAIQDDGFEWRGEGYQAHLASNQEVVDIEVAPNCILHDVTIDYLAANNEVEDVTNYSFTTYVNGKAEQSSRVVGKGVVTDYSVDGQEVTFSFANSEELQKEILGDQPCQTLAANIDLVNGAR